MTEATVGMARRRRGGYDGGGGGPGDDDEGGDNDEGGDDDAGGDDGAHDGADGDMGGGVGFAAGPRDRRVDNDKKNNFGGLPLTILTRKAQQGIVNLQERSSALEEAT